MSPRSYTCSLHVPYAHIDKMGFVYYANYLVYFEMARGSMLREAGIPYGELERRGVMLPVTEAHCQYKMPAQYEDLLEVKIHNLELRGPLFRVEYEITRGDDLIATGHTHHVCLSPAGKVLKPVPELKRLIREDPTAAPRDL